MYRRASLWVAFVLVHAAVAWAGWHFPSQPMGDVYHVYQPWSLQALTGQGVVGITSAWVYPQLALVPMMLAWALAWIGSYTQGWWLLMVLLDAIGFSLVVGDARSRGRRTAAWFWLGAILLLGPVALYRLDAATVPLAIAACLWLVRRPWVAGTLLAVGTWIKIWPAALIAAALVAGRRRLPLLITAAAVSVAVLAVVFAAGGGAVAFGFVGDQTGRGLQVEAAVSTPYVWLAMLRVPGASVFYNSDIITYEVTGPWAEAVASAMTPVLGVIVVALVAVGAYKLRRGAAFARLFPPLALALVLALIVANKVGSPQYLTWLVPPLVLALALDRRLWAGPAVVVLFASGLTQLIYPVMYDRMLATELTPVLVLSMRNLLLVALFVWVCVLLVRVPAGVGRSRGRAPALAADLGAAARG
ncbi:glycosyltransferase 87 family protein [Microbacterium sp. NPDC091313]